MATKNGNRRGGVREQKREKKTGRSRKPADDRNVVSAADLAGLLADPPFSDRWLRELTDRGFLVKLGRAQYDLKKSVLGYLRFVRETEVKGAETEVNARANFEIERARKLKLENDTSEAKLIDAQLAINAVDAVVGVYQTEVHSIPARVTNDVALRRQWEIEIDRVSDGINARCARAVANLAAGRDPLEDTGEDDA